jgi:hypothetical protein
MRVSHCRVVKKDPVAARPLLQHDGYLGHVLKPARGANDTLSNDRYTGTT